MVFSLQSIIAHSAGCAFVSDSDRLEHQLEEAVTLRQDYESSSTKLKALDKQVKALRQEKEDIHKVVRPSETRRPVHKRAFSQRKEHDKLMTFLFVRRLTFAFLFVFIMPHEVQY